MRERRLFAALWSAVDNHDGIEAIRKAHDLGITFFDTAELYGWGENERNVGRGPAPPGRGRDRVEVRVHTRRRFRQSPRPQSEIGRRQLQNLGVDHIDLYYQHRVDPDVPIEDVAGTVKEYINAGKVKYFGLSEAGPDPIRTAHAIQPVSVLQTEYSIFAREVETLFPVLEQPTIDLVPYSPLARAASSPAVSRLPICTTSPTHAAVATSRGGFLRTSPRTSGSPSAWRPLPPTRRFRLLSSLLPGCCSTVNTSCRSPVAATPTASQRTSPLSTST